LEVLFVDAKRILIVANQTAAGAHLKAEVRKRIETGPCTFTLLVPATPPREHAVWTDEEAYELAGKRLGVAMEGLAGMGAEIRGVVGDPSPLEAIGDELIAARYDEIILSTLPPGVSKWLKQDLPHRVERHFNVPVTHLASEPAAAL
jgi:hypothetical protein